MKLLQVEDFEAALKIHFPGKSAEEVMAGDLLEKMGRDSLLVENMRSFTLEEFYKLLRGSSRSRKLPMYLRANERPAKETIQG